jgi:hypothetical protein
MKTKAMGFFVVLLMFMSLFLGSPAPAGTIILDMGNSVDNISMQGASAGGTGQDSSAWTGVPYVDGGVWSGAGTFKDYATFLADKWTDNATNPADSPTQITSSPNNVIVRKFPSTASAWKTERFYWMPPADMTNATISFHWGGFITESTVPVAGETISVELACTALADSAALSTAVGGNATLTYTEPNPATHAQYDRLDPNTAGVPTYSSNITVANWAAGLPIQCRVRRQIVAGSYTTTLGISGLTVNFTRTMAP